MNINPLGLFIRLLPNIRPFALGVEMLPAVVAFEALGGVDSAAECRHGVDADVLKLASVAVERRLVCHTSVYRIAQGCILLRDVPAVQAHLPPGGGMPPSAAPPPITSYARFEGVLRTCKVAEG